MPHAEARFGEPFAYWLLLLRAEGLGELAESVQAELRRALESYVRRALTDAQVPHKDCLMRARESGMVLLVPPTTGPAFLLRDFVRSLEDHLNSHDDRYQASHCLSLRLGMHYGTVTMTGDHWSSRALHQLALLLKAPPAQPRPGRSDLLLVLSDAFHWAVVGAGCRGIRPSDYAPLEVATGSDGKPVLGWVTVAGRAGPPKWALPAPVDARHEVLPPAEPDRPHAGSVPRPVPAMSGPLIHPDFRLGGGGQGVVYAVVREVSGINGPLAYKEYLPDVPLDAEVLEDMVRFFGDLEHGAPADHAFLESRLAWPLRLGHRAGSPSGFVMRQVPVEYTLRSPRLRGPLPQAVEFLLNPEDYQRRLGLTVGDGQRLLLLKDLAGILATLHRHEITVGDLSPKNILFRLDIWPRCFLIDCDSMRFKGRDALVQVETPGWEVPEPDKATTWSDVYKFGLMALRLFNRNQDSVDRGPLSGVLPELAELAAHSVAKRPQDRPSMTDWLTAFERTAEGGKAVYSWVEVDVV